MVKLIYPPTRLSIHHPPPATHHKCTYEISVFIFSNSYTQSLIIHIVFIDICETTVHIFITLFSDDRGNLDTFNLEALQIPSRSIFDITSNIITIFSHVTLRPRKCVHDPRNTQAPEIRRYLIHIYFSYTASFSDPLEWTVHVSTVFPRPQTQSQLPPFAAGSLNFI